MSLTLRTLCFWFRPILALVCFSWIVSEALAQSGGQVEWQRVLQAAQSEGKVVAGIPASGELRQNLEKGFGEKFKGIQLELIPGPASTLASRILSESKVGVRNFDVFISGSGSSLGLVPEGILEPLEPYMALPEVKDPKYWFGGHIWADNMTSKRFVYCFQGYESKGIWYNSDIVKPEEIRSFDDFLGPKWKGKMGFHEPRRQGAGQAIWNYILITKGESFLKRLVQQDLLIASDLRQLGDQLAKGRLPLTFGVNYYVLLPYIKAGIPVKPLPTPKEGMQVSSGVGCMTMIKNPPHPNAAKVFSNWLLSKEGQEIFGKSVGQGTRRLDVDTKWLLEIGIHAAKDFLTVQEYLKRESFFEDKKPLREQAEELANKLLK